MGTSPESGWHSIPALHSGPYRRLSYFFGPLFKMRLLVPAADREEAERLVEATPFRIV